MRASQFKTPALYLARATFSAICRFILSGRLWWLLCFSCGAVAWKCDRCRCGVCGLCSLSWVLAAAWRGTATLTSPKQTSATRIWHMGHSPSRTWAIAELLVSFSLGQRLPPSHCFYMDLFLFFKFRFFPFSFPSCFFSTHTWRGRMQARACCIFPCTSENLLLFCFPIDRWRNVWFQLSVRKKSVFFFFFFQFVKTERIILCYFVLLLVSVSTLFSSGSEYGSVVFWLRNIFLSE